MGAALPPPGRPVRAVVGMGDGERGFAHTCARDAQVQGLCTHVCTERGLSVGVHTPAHTCPANHRKAEHPQRGHPRERPCRTMRVRGPLLPPHNKHPRKGGWWGGCHVGHPPHQAPVETRHFYWQPQAPAANTHPRGASPLPQDSQHSSSWGRIQPQYGVGTLIPSHCMCHRCTSPSP